MWIPPPSHIMLQFMLPPTRTPVTNWSTHPHYPTKSTCCWTHFEICAYVLSRGHSMLSHRGILLYGGVFTFLPESFCTLAKVLDKCLSLQHFPPSQAVSAKFVHESMFWREQSERSYVDRGATVPADCQAVYLVCSSKLLHV